MASQDSTIGARIGISLATIPLPAEPPTPPSWLTTWSRLSPKMCWAIFSPSAGSTCAEVDAPLDQRRVVLAQRLGERGRTGGVGGVGVEATEQGRQGGPGGLLHLRGVRPHLPGELLEVDLRQDLVHC